MKKNIIYTVLSLMIATLCWGSQEQETQFARAHVLYQQGNYKEASAILETINPKSYTVWFNLGICAYKQDQLALSLAYLRCARLASMDKRKDRIENAINFVEKKLGKPSQKLFIDKISALFDCMPLLIVQLIFILAWFLLFFFIKNRKHGKKYRSLFFVMTLFVAVASGIALGFKYHSIKQHRGIVMKPHVTLFAGPDEQYHVLATLDQASQLIIKDQRNDWFKVMSEHGSGWVMQDSIVVI